jgi:hypothetical protein
MSGLPYESVRPVRLFRINIVGSNLLDRDWSAALGRPVQPCCRAPCLKIEAPPLRSAWRGLDHDPSWLHLRHRLRLYKNSNVVNASSFAVARNTHQYQATRYIKRSRHHRGKLSQ